MSDRDSDLDLIRRCASGDEAALRRLVAIYQRLVYGIARRLLGSSEDAEEVAASAFLKLWRTAGSFRGECSVKSHLSRIAINLCRDRPMPRPFIAPPCPEAMADPRWERVTAAIRRLPSDDRELIVLYYLDEMDYAEIGAALGISGDVLKTRLVRARKRLRTLLEIDNG